MQEVVMSSRSMTRSMRALVALSAVGLLSLGSCDLAGDEGGPGPSPGISGGIPPGPLITPFALQNMRGNPGTADLESNSQSDRPSVSFTGRYWAFTSFATNLVAGVTDGRRHVYVRDMVNQTTQLV